MFPIRTKNRKAISVVMTTLIILVASVVLGTGVVLYGTSLFQTGVQTQSIATQGVKTWVASNFTAGYGWGAAAIRNNGDVLLSVSSITIRGVTLPYGNWYVDTNATEVGPNFQAQFITTGINSQGNMQTNVAYTSVGTCPAYNGNVATPNEITISENGTNDVIPGPYSRVMLCLQQQSGPVALKPAAQMIVYFKVPTGILTPVDSGSSITVNILAGNVGSPASVTAANS